MEQWDERQLIEYIKECMMNESGAVTCEKIIKDIERLQRKSFMEGYCYAIEVLKDGILKEKE